MHAKTRQFSNRPNKLLTQESDKGKMDGLVYNESNNTNCLNFSENLIKDYLGLRIFGIIGIPLLLVPTLILQLFFIYRYKSTLLHRQFLYTTVVVILMNAIYTVYQSTVYVGCPFFQQIVNSLNRYLFYVEMIQMTTIHLLLLYKLCKHIETRTMQRLRTLCCNIRPRLWHDVMIVCIQIGLPLPILITEVVVMIKTFSMLEFLIDVLEMNCFIRPLLAVNILLGLICTVLLVLWFGMLWKRNLLSNKVKFVYTQMGHILFVLVVFFIWNIIYLCSFFPYSIIVLSVIRTFSPVSFGLYILMSLPNLQKKVTTKAQVPATNRHTNPPSTRVSLPTDTAEHAPNFLSPSTAEHSEVTPLINDDTFL